MNKLEAVLILIIIICISWLGFSMIEEHHANEIAVLKNRIAILEETIENYEVIEALNDEIELVSLRQAEIDGNNWIKWIGDNRWILGIEWGE